MTANDELDALFGAVAARTAPPSAALTARVLADAAALQPRPKSLAVQALAPVAGMRPRLGWFASLAGVFGGGGALAGMSLAAITGVFIGVAQPGAVLTWAQTISGTATLESYDLLPSADQLLAQE